MVVAAEVATAAAVGVDMVAVTAAAVGAEVRVLAAPQSLSEISHGPLPIPTSPVHRLILMRLKARKAFIMETSQKQEFLVTTTQWDPAQVVSKKSFFGIKIIFRTK